MILTKLCRRHNLRFGFGLVCLFASAVILYVSQRYHLHCLCGEAGPPRSLQMKTRLFQSLQLPQFGQVNCSGIIQGVQSDVEEALLDSLKIANKRLRVTEQEYLNLTKDCNHYKVRRQFIPIPLSKEEEDFPIAYSMVVHEKIEMFERLLRAIYAPQNIYCVHVDDKSPEIYKQAIRAIASCFGNVFVASKLERLVYASWLRVQADLNCMEDLLKSEVQWRYLLNTCGTDFPIKTNAEIVRTLKFLNGRNSMESEKTPEHKKRRWQFHYELTNDIVKTDIPKSPPPIKSPMFSGNAYFVVSRDFVEYIFKKDTDVEKLLEWEKDTYSPDEHLWATLQRMPGVPRSSPYHDKYHLSDMNAVARLVKWEYLEGDVSQGHPYPPCTGTHRNSVCVYGAGDLNWMLQQHHLFANKFDPTVDNTAIQCLEEYLRLKALHGIEL